MAREPIPTWCFVLVVVRHEGRFLLVQECDRRWYLPAGRVEPGESFAEAACRETLEEGGIEVQLTGVLRVEHSPGLEGARLRVVFLAEPAGNTLPKSVTDEESLGAMWGTLDDLKALALRGEEVAAIIRYVASGGPVLPLSVIQPEGSAFHVEVLARVAESG